MNNTIYENTKTAVMSFLSKLIEKAIDPYALEIEGSFKLDNLRHKLEKTLKDTVTLINAWGYSDNKSRIHDISLLCARRMCAQINNEVFALYRSQCKDTFFMIDFNAFSGRISELLNEEFVQMDARKNF